MAYIEIFQISECQKERRVNAFRNVLTMATHHSGNK